MASKGKKKTTMAKLNREARLRERRQIKNANKLERQRLRNEPPAEIDETASEPDGVEPGVDALEETAADL
jgi:hypothetical protein